MRTRLIAVLVTLAAVTVFTTEASAMYHAAMGRFLQRDPVGGAAGPARIGAGGAPATTGSFIPLDPTGSNQYADGMNLYQYVGSNPVVYVDPLGLWKIKREGDPKAAAEAEAGDTIKGWPTLSDSMKTSFSNG